MSSSLSAPQTVAEMPTIAASNQIENEIILYPHKYTKMANVDFEGKRQSKSDTWGLAYGTAGFRTDARQLSYVVYRTGFFAAKKSRQLDQVVGVMITASHNQESDNGVKVIGPMGEMIGKEDEEELTRLVSLSDAQFHREVQNIRELRNDIKCHVGVYVGYDTRVSSPYLASAAIAGAATVYITAKNFDLVTTPMLHYIVRAKNDPKFGPPKVAGYYERFGKAFKKLYRMIPEPTNESFRSFVRVDCANGVGAEKLRELMQVINGGQQNYLWKADIVNDGTKESDKLNEECGADYVKIKATLPRSLEHSIGDRCASFDGDADRLVYFDVPHSGPVRLLDGDKIAALFAKFITEQYHMTEFNELPEIAVIQTAYANGASTSYLKELLGKDNVVCVNTGVKHLHAAAKQWDIGIYFEANGHGTVHFKDSVVKRLKNKTVQSCVPAVRRLHLFFRLINEAVGDAMTDLLAVEAILKYYDWTTSCWADNLYHDLPNQQFKVPVSDRTVFKSCPTKESILLEPKELQLKINELVVEAGKQARCFVRPSGTEPIVRVYVEAETTEVVKSIGQQVVALVKQFAESGQK